MAAKGWNRQMVDRTPYAGRPGAERQDAGSGRVGHVPAGPPLGVTRTEPVVFGLVEDPSVFAPHVIHEVAPKAGRGAFAVLAGVLAGLGAGAWAVAYDQHVSKAVGILGFVALVVGGFLNYIRGAWYGWIVASVLVVGTGVARSMSVEVIVHLALVLFCGWMAWRGDRSRSRWWPPLRLLLTEHRMAPGVITYVRSAGGSSSPTSRPYLIRVESPALPGRQWVTPCRSEWGWSPYVGRPVVVWYRPSDPRVALVLGEGPQRTPEGFTVFPRT